ncbi:MAG: acetamidase/formamidase family protein [Nitrososphaeria archaeon]|jgi:acetamidase/formamidase
MKKLSLKDQGEFCFSIGQYNKPRLKVNPGETVVVETEDAAGGQFRRIGDKRDYKKMPYGNPVFGPVYVNGAEKGDTLVVDIGDIVPTIGQGYIMVSRWWLYLGHSKTNRIMSSFLEPKLPDDLNLKILPIKDGKVYFDGLTLPYKPMVGTIGTAPELESILSFLPGPHGGNMDLPSITKGCKIYLPVKVEGALLHLGDVHGLQGQCEISGTGLEMPAEVTFKTDLIKGQDIDWPRLENDEYIMSVACSGTGRSSDDAIRLAFVNLALWMEKDYGMKRWDIWELCSLLSNIEDGNGWCVAASFPKKYLPKKIGK